MNKIILNFKNTYEKKDYRIYIEERKIKYLKVTNTTTGKSDMIFPSDKEQMIASLSLNISNEDFEYLMDNIVEKTDCNKERIIKLKNKLLKL